MTKHDKKLFKNRLEKPCQEQDSFFYQYRRFIRWYGSGNANWPLDLGRGVI